MSVTEMEKEREEKKKLRERSYHGYEIVERKERENLNPVVCLGIRVVMRESEVRTK